MPPNDRHTPSTHAWSVDDLLRLALTYEVEVEEQHLPDGLLGCYIPHSGRIVVDSRLTPHEMRSVLAHEIGHAHYSHAHRPQRGMAEEERWERQADAFAARLLIDDEAYAFHERINDDPSYIADELDVTPELIIRYRELCLATSHTRTPVTHVGAGRAERSAGPAPSSFDQYFAD